MYKLQKNCSATWHYASFMCPQKKPEGRAEKPEPVKRPVLPD